MLKTNIDSKVNVIDDIKVKVGDTGKADSRLVPAGKAFINGEYFEVRTTGEFIDPGTELVVTKVEFNKIFVKRKS
jgi:membrane-bound serine protease (ClpP class)